MLIGLAVGAGLALLSVNIFPSITNDSTIYLDHSRALPTKGFIEAGYRQFGYPLYLALTRKGAEFFGVDPMLVAALIQRLLLVLVIVLAWLTWRWWSLPLIVLLLSAGTLAFTNFLLTEGLALPLAALITFPALYCIRAFRRTEIDTMKVIASAIVVAVIAAGLFSLRYSFAVFGAVPLIVFIASWNTGLRRSMAVVFAAFVVAVAGMVIAMSIENDREFGAFTPSASGGPTRYYYAWNQVFLLQPENQEDPALAEYWDDGQRRHFLVEMINSGLPYDEVEQRHIEETRAMLDAAGLSPGGTRIVSALSTLYGGRMDDVEAAVEKIVLANRETIDRPTYLNTFAEQNGFDRFEERFNDGTDVEVIITDPIGWHIPSPGTQGLLRVLLPVSLIVMVLGLWRRDTRMLALAGLMVVLGQAVGLGWLRSDNLRFLLPGAVFGISVGTAVASLRWGRPAPSAET